MVADFRLNPASLSVKIEMIFFLNQVKSSILYVLIIRVLLVERSHEVYERLPFTSSN